MIQGSDLNMQLKYFQNNYIAMKVIGSLLPIRVWSKQADLLGQIQTRARQSAVPRQNEGELTPRYGTG